MDTKDYFKTKPIRNVLIIFTALILSLYFYLSLTNHLLFHTIISFSIMTLGVIASTVGILTSFRMKRNIISKLSPSMFVYTMLLFIHMMSFSGMEIFSNLGESFSSQVWLSGNAILAVGCFITVIDYKGRLSVLFRLLVALLIGCLFFSLSFFEILPNTFINGNPITLFKVIQSSIIGLYVISLVLWLFNKELRKNKDYKNVFLVIILFLLSEILLVNHFTSEALNIYLGLALRFSGFMIIMYTTFVVNLIKPYNFLYTSIIDDNNLQRKLKNDNFDLIRRLSRSQAIANVGTWELDIKTGEIWASDESFRIYGLDINEDNIIIYEDIKNIASEEDRPKLDKALKNLIERNIHYNMTFTILNKKGDCHHINSVASLKYENDKPVLVYGVINDITDIKNEQDKLRYASYHDHLTNLYNRRYFLEQRAALNFDRFLPVSMFILDINGLKIINDSFGHHAGNQVLKKLSSVISNYITKENSFVARIGGDEFSVILPNTESKEAEKIMQVIIEKLNQEKVGNINLSIAYGLAIKEKTNDSFEDVLKKAEDDMYLNKISNSQSVRNGIIDALLKTLYEKDTISEQHSQRVSNLAYSLATAANLSGKKSSDIKAAGLLHDIGKITLPNSILNKKGKLTEEEYNIIKTHPEKGYKIIHSIGGMDIIANYVVQHHERYDGLGYPKGLSKDDISYEGRIICIADAYDAMTSFRTYKKVATVDEAVKELISCKGTHFDPELVDIFIKNVIKYDLNSKGTI